MYRLLNADYWPPFISERLSASAIKLRIRRIGHECKSICIIEIRMGKNLNI